jgi:serine/threonine protein phosphatase PrpC
MAQSFPASPTQVVQNTQAPQAQTGSFSVQGVKPNNPNWVNQDTHLELNLSGGKMLLGVFDGHGPQGTHVANSVKSIFTEQAHAVASASDIRGALHRVFTQACNQFRNDPVGKESGTTATVALVDTAAQRISIANVGDSTAIVIDPRGSIIFASQDHKAVNESEAQRLRACGGTIQNGRVIAKSPNQYMTEATLALTRTIGDSQFATQGVNGEPEIVTDVKFESGSSLIIASDGVWDVVSRDEAAKMNIKLTPQDFAQQIVNVARSKWMKAHATSDDITAVSVKSAPNEFDPNGKNRQDFFDSRIFGA